MMDLSWILLLSRQNVGNVGASLPIRHYWNLPCPSDLSRPKKSSSTRDLARVYIRPPGKLVLHYSHSPLSATICLLLRLSYNVTKSAESLRIGTPLAMSKGSCQVGLSSPSPRMTVFSCATARTISCARAQRICFAGRCPGDI
jgi:hypothetical protein